MARLEDRHLAKIGGKLSVKALKMISVVYGMGLEQHELEDIESAGRADKDGKKRKILIKWRNSGGKKEVKKKTKETIHIISSKPISKRGTTKSIH